MLYEGRLVIGDARTCSQIDARLFSWKTFS
jgi:hypothetical protein